MGWNDGYVTDIQYTHGFYRELTPALLALVQLVRGPRPGVGTDAANYCELGCGQGFTANLLAAANPHIQFHANDFNPGQIAGARRLAQEGGVSNAHFYEKSFADLSEAPGLPDSFDFIAMHGIYSWISDENRQHIIRFIRDRLKPTGLVYLSYNSQPGWASAMPLRRLLHDLGSRGTGDVVTRIEDALKTIERVTEVGALVAKSNPGFTSRLEKLKTAPRAYVAHEYFNEQWRPEYFADVARELFEAKLEFTGSAHISDMLDAFDLSAEMIQLLSEQTDTISRESMRDYLISQDFRRDVYSKGSEQHTVASSTATWENTRFALSTIRSRVPTTVKGRRGEINLMAEIYNPVLDALADGPKTSGELMSNAAVRALGWGRVKEALLVLVGTNHVQPCLDAKDDKRRGRSTRSFNQAVLKRAELGAELSSIASPVTGGGLTLDRFSQLFLSAVHQNREDTVEWIWRLLDAQSQRLVKDGQPLQSRDENIHELEERYETFTNERLPVLRQLGVV